MMPTEGGLNPTVPAPPTPSRRHRSLLLPWVGFFFAAAALASLYLLGGNPNAGFLERLYRSVVIFTGSGGWAFEATKDIPNANMLFRVLSVMAPIVTALGIVELATGAIRPLSIRLKASVLYRKRTIVALFGLDPSSLRFAQALLASETVRPVIYAREPDEQLAQRAARLGIPLASSPVPWRTRVWCRLKDWIGTREPGEKMADLIVLQHAVADVISFLPSIDAQIDLAARLRSLRPQDAEPNLRVLFLMADRGFAQRLDDTLKFAHSTNGLHPRLVDLDELAARLLLTQHPLDMVSDVAGQSQIHLAIYGFGRLGRAVAKEAARLYVTRARLLGRKVKITIIDQSDDPARAWLAEDPGIEDVVDLTSIDGKTLSSSGLTAADVLTIVPSAVTAHVITLGDPRAAFALAVSLRRWLLEPPEADPETHNQWAQTHRPAPIFIRPADRKGLGRLMEGGIPDGIFAFGAQETLFSSETLISREREEAANAAHGAYRASMVDLSGPAAAREKREAELEWARLAPQLRDSNFHAVSHLRIKARAVGYRLVANTQDTPAPTWPPDEETSLLLSRLEHFRYMAERQANGWRYAPNRCDAVRVHPDLIPWEALAVGEQSLDTKHIEAMPNIAKALKMHLAEALVIGVTGHLDDPARVDAVHVKQVLLATLRQLSEANPGRALVLLTTLAPGTDSWAADSAALLGIPYQAVLPLPYEVYREDFTADGALRTFLRQIAGAEYYLEVPLRAGRVSALTTRGKLPANLARRAEQYALAGAYIVERAHQMIAVWDGQASRGVGGTAEMLAWSENGVPEPWRTPALFRAPVQPAPPLVLPSRPPSTLRVR